MLRNCSLEEISDGRLYDQTDMVKAYCNECKGCHACCEGMGNSIILDPLDVSRLTKETGKSFEALLADTIELNVVDGLILPNIKMVNGTCTFLNAEGRCGIHAARPGFCRLFPLGRYYEDGGFKYFLQIHECDRAGKVKVKVSKWIDIQSTLMSGMIFRSRCRRHLHGSVCRTGQKKVRMHGSSRCVCIF